MERYDTSTMNSRLRNFLIIFIGLLLLSGWLFISLWKPGPLTDSVRIYIPRGSTYEAVLDTLTKHDCVSNVTLTKSIQRFIGYPKHVKSGSYIITPDMGIIRLSMKLHRGNQDPVTLTINGARTIRQLSERIAAQLEFGADTLIHLLSNDSVCADFGLTPHTVIALFQRNTYEVYWNITPQHFLQRMHNEFDAFWTSERKRKAQAMNLTQAEVVTLASIVEEETNQDDEKENIASVYLNRLRMGMPLQADPTVKFATGNFALRRITSAVLSVESPYNTYRHKGLPPGPICLPTTASIDAVLANKKTPYYFFCAKEDFSGHHNFATTLAEHNGNAARYHKALNAKGIK